VGDFFQANFHGTGRSGRAGPLGGLPNRLNGDEAEFQIDSGVFGDWAENTLWIIASDPFHVIPIAEAALSLVRGSQIPRRQNKEMEKPRRGRTQQTPSLGLPLLSSF